MTKAEKIAKLAAEIKQHWAEARRGYRFEEELAKVKTAKLRKLVQKKRIIIH